MDILKGMILECLPCLTSELARKISCQIGYLEPIREAYLSGALKDLVDSQLISRKDHFYKLLALGEKARDERAEAGAARALSGFMMMREILDRIVGRAVPTSDYGRIWSVIEDGLANLFLEHGLAVIAGLRGLASGEVSPQQIESAEAIGRGLSQIASKIRRLNIDPEVAAQIADALPSALSQTQGEGFEWLSHLCVMYIASCSLGLDPDAQDQILNRLKNWEILLDTHFVLSLLGVGEADHAAVKQIVSAWNALGCKMHVATPVVEEASHHAKSAYEKFDRWCEALERSSRQAGRCGKAVLLPADNVFLRSYAAMAGDDTLPTECLEYLLNYYSPGQDGPVRVKRVLCEEHGLEYISDDGVNGVLAATLTDQFLTERRARDLCDEISRRAKFDGSLIALLIHRRHFHRETCKRTVIASSSVSLRKACERYPRELGLVSGVLNLTRFSFALALLPQATINLNVLRTVLFDPGFAKHVAPSYGVAKKLLNSQKSSTYRFSGSVRMQESIDEHIVGFKVVAADKKPFGKPKMIRAK